jgi:phosphate transport system permease protein
MVLVYYYHYFRGRNAQHTARAMKEASLALASHWQTIIKVVTPYSASGITAGAILGIGRAIGETMAVLMVTGNAVTYTFLAPIRTIPATIAAELVRLKRLAL